VYEAKIDAMALEEKAQQDKDTKMAFTKTDASAQTTQKITNAQKNAIRKLTDEQLKNPGAAKCVVSSGLLDLYAGAIAARSGAAANAGSLP
jgi:ribulose kinase